MVPIKRFERVGFIIIFYSLCAPETDGFISAGETNAIPQA
jgi:hypothetical protein